MSDFKVEFTLKQHTPIIHFQHEQEGATLRATELKAKLDAYLIKKMVSDNSKAAFAKFQANPIWRSWLIGSDQAKNPALDYKIKIQDLDAQPIKGSTALITRDDIGSWKKSGKGLSVEIFSFHPKLLQEIELAIHPFFACNNFGKRQSKGWGSFFPNTREDQFEQLLMSSKLPVYKYSSNISSQPDDRFYEKVVEIWRLLKSGKNFNNDYRKSLVFKYAASKGFRWDKRLIKKDIFKLIDAGKLRHNLMGNKSPIDSSKTGNECDTDNEDGYVGWDENPNFQGEYRFVRALLGLPELYEFQASGGFIHQVSFSNAEVERYKSPVTFKVFGRNLYAIAEPMPSDVFNQTFSASIKSKAKSDGGNVGPFEMPSNLKTPSSQEFNLEEFLDEYFPCVNMIRIN